MTLITRHKLRTLSVDRENQNRFYLFLTMSTLKEAREMLSLAWSHHFISEEEFLLLYDASFSKNPSFPHADYDRFDLDSMDEAECFHEFRVRKWTLLDLLMSLDYLRVYAATNELRPIA